MTCHPTIACLFAWRCLLIAPFRWSNIFPIPSLHLELYGFSHSANFQLTDTCNVIVFQPSKLTQESHCRTLATISSVLPDDFSFS